MQPFNPRTIPLSGRQLIEASAGTGKTYSLVLLFLRLILERQLEVEQILVVTFTTAATEELRGRIRARLRQALDLLEGTGSGQEGDILAELLAALPDREEARRRLADTLTRMDESAIYTIHGFCQRMLQDQAFEAGIPFGVQFIESEEFLRREIFEDFWRLRFYPGSAGEAQWAAAMWQDPAGLAQVLQGPLARPGVSFLPEVPAEQLQQLRAAAERGWAEVRQLWLREREAVTVLLREDPCLSRDNRKGYGPEPLARTLAAMDQLAEEETMAWQPPPGVELLAASEMAGRLRGKRIPPRHPFFTLFDDWYRQQREFVQAARAHILAEAYRFARVELDRRKRAQGVLSFDDQLAGLAAALAGENGQELVRRIRSRFRVALVDEFQDTDPQQYRIFQTLFGHPPEPGLFMIGDPKQSIYAFRGADIFAYIRARRETAAGSAHTMDSNYRSAPAMVRAVNRLFSRRPHFVFAEIEFHPVRPGRQPDPELTLLVAGGTPAPLQVMLLPPALAAAGKPMIAKNRAEAAAADWTARQIALLLALGRQGQAGFPERPLAGGDLAVLVRTHREAELIRGAFRRWDIASVYSGQDSVFATDEADQLYHLLAALLDPSDEVQVNHALVTDFFALDAPALHALRSDQLRWGAVGAELAEYRFCWLGSGVMAMLHQLLHRRRVVRRLLAASGGERKLTNYLHLAELLQEAALHLRAEELLRWLAQQRLAPEAGAASQQLRLESDDDLVRLVTIHKAKGLEYPLVFLPFLWSARPVRPEGVFSFHDRAGRLFADLGSGLAENFRRAERERLAEDLRLLYVAMTRARCSCSFCWGPIASMEQSALAWLLHPEEGGGEGVARPLTAEQIGADLASLDQGEGLVHFLPWPEQEENIPGSVAPLPGPLQARVFTGRIDRAWAVSSYSRLVGGEGAAPESAGPGVPSPAASPAGGSSAFAFPRGAAAGSFLHAVLEKVDFQDAAAIGSERVADLLRQYGLAQQWAPLVLTWMAQVTRTPLLDGDELCLALVDRGARLAELGFHFSLQRVEPTALNAVLAAHAVAPLALHQGRLHGLMKGYIDLVFRHQGRYYLADYKSNYLGATPEDYRFAALQRAIAAHRYDLQSLIYTVALHRYLGRRLRNYDYGRDFGGVFYLFLRGMHPDQGAGCGIWHALPAPALIADLDRCCGGMEGN